MNTTITRGLLDRSKKLFKRFSKKQRHAWVRAKLYCIGYLPRTPVGCKDETDPKHYRFARTR